MSLKHSILSTKPNRLRTHDDVIRDEIGFLWARLTGGLATAKWKRMRLGVCSTFAGEGTTTVATNCALYLAEHGKTVVLVEANLRRPVLASHFRVAPAPGLWEALTGSAETAACARQDIVPNLTLVPAGAAPPRFTAGLGEVELQRVVEPFDQNSDVMVFDLPPLAASPEIVAFSRLLDAVVLVVRANQTTKSEVRRALKIVQDLGLPLAGTVLNECRHVLPAALAKVF